MCVGVVEGVSVGVVEIVVERVLEYGCVCRSVGVSVCRSGVGVVKGVLE